MEAVHTGVLVCLIKLPPCLSPLPAMRTAKTAASGRGTQSRPKDQLNVVGMVGYAAPRESILTNITEGEYVDYGDICWHADVGFVFVQNRCTNDSTVAVDVMTPPPLMHTFLRSRPQTGACTSQAAGAPHQCTVQRSARQKQPLAGRN